MDSSGRPPPPKPPAWKTCLDVVNQEADHYYDHYNATLLDMVDTAPTRALDLGCAGGKFGAMLKERFASAYVIGVDANRAAATKAATRLDQVIVSGLDDIDFAAHGLRHGEIDLVIAADILEHLVNPWSLLARLKPFLVRDARVLISIPNVRNIGLVSDLLDGGRWEYQERGLLDVTHLRFFSLAELGRMLADTGYVADNFALNITQSLSEFYRKYEKQPKGPVQLGRLTMADVGPRELAEICAEQFFLRVRPA